MKILLVSAGLAPKRLGGVPLYLVEYREQLTARGHFVVYLDSSCQDRSKRPRIARTSVDLEEYGFYNSGSRLPWKEAPPPLSDIRATEEAKQCLLDFVGEIKPDIIHFQEVLCTPVEFASLLRKEKYRVIFSAHDYFSICPTIQLFRHDEKLCNLTADKLICQQCVAKRALVSWPPLFAQLRPIIEKLPLGQFGRRAVWALVRRALAPFEHLLFRWTHSKKSYRLRRLEAISHLRSFELILCDSKLQAELITRLTGLNNIRQVYTSRLTHAGHRNLAPGRSRRNSEVTKFVAININQNIKGKDLLISEFRSLYNEKKDVELHLFGTTGKSGDGIVFRPPFKDSEYNAILEEMDAGIIPSIWPETYGHVGPEMLVRGVPLVASSAGAMREYVIDGFNGLLFDPCQPGSLKSAMKLLATDSALLQSLKVNAPTSQEGIVSFESHLDQMESVYHELFATVDRQS